MQLPSRLGTTTLGDLLGSMHRQGISGVLELTEAEGARHRIHLLAGVVLDVETAGAGPKLGELLKQVCRLTPERRRELERCLLETGAPLGAELLSRGLVTPEELGQALRLQNKLRLDRLFLLKDAALSFRTARPSAKPREALPAFEFLPGRPRQRDRDAQGTPNGVRQSAAEARRLQALAVLGLPSDATREAILVAFRRLAASLHPDRQTSSSFAERAQSVREFARLSAAYHSLVA